MGIAEFAATLSVIVLVVFFLLDLLSVLTGYAVIQLTGRQASFKAATADSLSTALFDVESTTGNMTQSGLGRFARMKPVGGYNNSGADLFINATKVATGTTTQIGPNLGIPRPVDSDSNVYECAARLTFEVGPLVPFSGVPLIKDIPGCGKPAIITTATNIAVEHPERLASVGSGVPAPGGSSSQPPGTGISPGSGGASTGYLGGWNYPIAGYFVLMPGQVILEQKDLSVSGRGPDPYGPDEDNWTDTNIDVLVDNRLSIAWNFHAMGMWSHGGGAYDAEGLSNIPCYYNMHVGVMIGKIGKHGAPFKVGKDFYNYNPVDTGRLYLRMNDGPMGFYNNYGEQVVTVFRTN